MKPISRIFVWLNVVCLFVFGWLCVDVFLLAPTMVAMRFTELDRREVINADKLAEGFPNLALDLRGLVPSWLTEPLTTPGRAAAVLGMGLASLNIAYAVHCAFLSFRARHRNNAADG